MDVSVATQTIVDEIVMNAPEGVKFPPQWKIEFFRNSPTAGRAQGICIIKINADLAEQYPEQLRDTVIHEMAHCLVHLNYDHRCKPHGVEWQDMMQLLGQEPERCHRMEQPNLKRKRQRRHTYECNCQTHRVATTTHHKMVVHGREYRCRGCKGVLRYIGE